MSPFLKPLIHQGSLTALLPVALLLMMQPVQAVPLSLDTALSLATQNSAELSANSAQVDAAQSAAIPAGALPNPKVFAGLESFPVTGAEAGQLNTDSMTMQKIGVVQDIPSAAKRRAQVEMSQAKVSVAQAQGPIVRLKVREVTAIAWFNRYYLERKLALFDGVLLENQHLTQAVQAQIAGGRGQLADALVPQMEAAELEDQRDDLRRDLVKAKAALRRYLGASTDLDQPLTLDAPRLPVDAEHLHQHLHHHPELVAFDAESELAAAQLSAAKSLKTSDMSIELAYGHRAAQFGDMVGVQVSFELPIFSSRRVAPLITAAESAQADIAAQRAVMLRDHTLALENDLADYTALNQQIARAQSTLLPLATQKVTLQLASYQAGKADLSGVITARRALIEQRLKILTLQNIQAVTAAELYFAYGGEDDGAALIYANSAGAQQ